VNNLYHKINGPFKRDMTQKHKPLIINDWAVPEFEMLKDVWWTAYEKIDGTNIRVMFDGITVTFGGRTDRAEIPAHLTMRLGSLFNAQQLKLIFPDASEKSPVTLYGEGFGHKIQKGGLYLPNNEVDFILFDVSVGNWVLTKPDVEDIAEKLNIRVVPHVLTGTLQNIMTTVSLGLKSSFGDFYAEGVVATPELELFGRNGKRIITKIKHKDFFNVKK